MDELSLFDYDLPEALIAQHPLEDRSASRMLWIRGKEGPREDRAFVDIVELLQAGDTIVLNDTRVSSMRLFGRRPSGAKIEAFLLAPSGREGEFRCLLKPSKRIKEGEILEFEEGLVARAGPKGPDIERLLSFEAVDDLQQKLEAIALAPLPPYIHAPLADLNRYQTVYAHHGQSSAAPTAGLHFTHEILRALGKKGVKIATVNLNVGLDTFRPIHAQKVSEHQMHGEWCEISPECADIINTTPGRVVAVGTTSMRTLESFATGEGRVEPGQKNTTIFLHPGVCPQVVQGLVTNFHMPRTSMLLMLSTLVRPEYLMETYRHAVREKYRFLSFGDSMCILEG